MLLNIENLKKDYGQFQLHCSLQVKEGTVVGFVGQNGAGKTTTFKALLGLIKIDGGMIELFGKPMEELTAADKRKIGVVLNDSGFSEYLTIQSIIPVLSELYPAFDREEFIKKCTYFSLPMKKKIKEFSTGMKAKLKLLIAISHGAQLLILDEPTAGLDVIARDELLDMLREFMEDESHAILISSHISSDLESLCDEFYMIHDGGVILHEETDVLLSNYGILKVDATQYQELDKEYILRIKKEGYGYKCLTKEKQFYLDNYPNLVVEKGNMDEMIMMMVKGKTL